MANKNHKTICLYWTIIMWLVTLDAISQVLVEGSPTLDKTKFGPEPEGTVKTIEVYEDGDIIDCVDIYKQPSLKDPLIKKGFQMAPRKVPISLFNRTKNPSLKVSQNWRRYGECPKGTIPIRRTWNNNVTIHRETYNDEFLHEHANGYQVGRFYGAGGQFNLWNPRVVGYEFSKSYVWAVSRRPEVNVIECGWIVHPRYYRGSTATRLYTQWTRDGYGRTGCYDNTCGGFVQTNHHWTLGGVLQPVSIFQGDQVSIQITFYRDPETRYWWLYLDGARVGYFPPSTVPGLEHGTTSGVGFGGEILNSKPDNRHTRTEMGSGLFPQDGNGEASFIKTIKVINEQLEVVDASLTALITRPECYNLIFGPRETVFGTYFYYGGPGYSTNCYEGYILFLV